MSAPLFLDLIIVLGFVIYSISNGFLNRARASKNLEEYFLAGRSIKGWRAGFSLAATQYAADTPLLMAGLIAAGGIFMLWRLWIYGLGFLMIGFLLGGPWRHAGVITDAELTEIRYSGRGVLALRTLKAVYYGTVMNCTIMAMVLVAAIRISEIFLLWNQWFPANIYNPIYHIVKFIGIPLTSGVTGLETYTASTNNLISIFLIIGFTALYSTTGGLRSVIATDTVQFSIAMIGSLAYAVIVLVKSGGIGNIFGRLSDIYGKAHTLEFLSFCPKGLEAFMPFLVIISLQWFFERNSDGTGYFAQRMMACRSDRDAQKAALIFTWLQIFFRSLIWLVIGVGLLLIYPFDAASMGSEAFVAEREVLFAVGIKDLLPPGIRGLMLTGMLAALASTIDTHLSWGASYWSNDIYLRLINRAWLKREPSRREQVVFARLSNIVILLIALVIMTNLGSIRTAWYITLLFGAGIGGVLILRWVWERINIFSEITAIVVSLLCAPLILFLVEAEWLRLLFMSSVSTIAVVAVTLLTRPTDKNTLAAFYRRVEPPGFWGRTAQIAGEDGAIPYKRLKSGLFLTVTASLSVYFLLVGVGKLLFHSGNTPSFYSWAYTALGIITIPLWWRRWSFRQ